MPGKPGRKGGRGKLRAAALGPRWEPGCLQARGGEGGGEREGGSWLGKANKQSCCLSGVPVCRGRERWEESCDAGLGCFWSPRKQAGLKGRATNLLEDSKAEPEEGPPLSSTRGPALSPPGPRTHLGFLLPFWLLPFVLVC